MNRLVNDPVEFSAELVDGFIQANTRYVRPVYGGVVRSTETKPGKVAIVTGGGLGHYPGFMGWVGPGLVDGAVTGKVFASPAASQVHSVAKAADHGGGHKRFLTGRKPATPTGFVNDAPCVGSMASLSLEKGKTRPGSDRKVARNSSTTPSQSLSKPSQPSAAPG